VAVAGRHRVHLLAVPVERLVVEPALVDAAIVPFDGRGAPVVLMITALRGTGTVAALPWVSVGRCEPYTGESCNPDSRCECRY